MGRPVSRDPIFHVNFGAKGSSEILGTYLAKGFLMLKFFVNPGLLVIADCIYHTSFWIAHKVDCTQMSKNMFVQLSTDM